jgi:ferric-dicitrate binding protein FerR (iron transport regulator)
MENDRIWTLLTRKLSGEATPTELRELELIISRNPELKRTISSLSQSWAAGVPTDSEFLEATYLQHLERMKERGFSINSEEPVLNEVTPVFPVPTGKPFYLRQILISVLVLGLVIATWIIIKKPAEEIAYRKNDDIGLVSTNNGSRTKLMLPDGSSVWLNAGSKLTFDKSFDAPLREVFLTGEAFFDVVKNPERPFIIHTIKMDVKVLGTQFNVKAYEQDKTTETSLIKGSVEVFLKNNPQKKYMLRPNEKLVLLNNPAAKITKNPAKNIPPDAAPYAEIRPLTYLQGSKTNIESSWIKNILSFEDESFTEVAKKMERWYDVSIEFRNKKWEYHYLKGSFEKENLEQALNALKFSTGFNYIIEGKTIYIY